MIHSFSLEQGMDYHMIKPMLCCLFPTTIDNGLLRPAYDAQDGSLICLVEGLSLYRGVRDELLFYFGKEFTNELDQMEIATIETIGGK